MTQAVLKVGTLQQVNCFNIAELAARWIQFAQVSASSRKAYDKGIKRLKEYLAANQIVDTPTRAELLNYREHLGNTYSAATSNLYLTSCKLFFQFLAVEGYIAKNPSEHLKGYKIFETRSQLFGGTGPV